MPTTFSLTATTRSKSSKCSFAASSQSPRCPAAARSKPSDLSLTAFRPKSLKFSLVAAAHISSSQSLAAAVNLIIRSKPPKFSINAIASLQRPAIAARSQTANITIRSKPPDLSLTTARPKSLKFSLVATAHISSSRSLASARPKPAKSNITVIKSLQSLAIAARSRSAKPSLVAIASSLAVICAKHSLAVFASRSSPHPSFKTGTLVHASQISSVCLAFP
jgi:hypothetical protein